MKRNLPAAVLALAIACPLVAHAQSVTIIGEGNPGASGATRNTTGASAYSSTTREDAGSAGAAAGGTMNVNPVPSTAGRSDGSGIGANTGTTTGAGGSTSGIGGTSSGVGGTAGSTTGTTGGTTGMGGTTGASGSPGAAGGGGAGGGAAGGR